MKYEIFAGYVTFSLYPYFYLQVCTRCTGMFNAIWESIPGQRRIHTWENLPEPGPCRSFPQLGGSRPIHVSIRPRARLAASNNLFNKFHSLFSRVFRQQPTNLFETRFKISQRFYSFQFCATTWIVRFKSESNRAEFRHDHGVLGNRAVEIPWEQLPLVVHALQLLQGHAAPEFSGSDHVERVSVQMVHQVVEATCQRWKKKKIIEILYSCLTRFYFLKVELFKRLITISHVPFPRSRTTTHGVKSRGKNFPRRGRGL